MIALVIVSSVVMLVVAAALAMTIPDGFGSRDMTEEEFVCFMAAI